MKKISTLAVSISFIMLTGCGGGSSSSNNTENVSSQERWSHMFEQLKAYL